MSVDEFLMRLETIALKYNLRLFMTRAPIGCGFLLYFTNNSGEYSKQVVYLLNHNEPEEIFERLESVASELFIRKENNE